MLLFVYQVFVGEINGVILNEQVLTFEKNKVLKATSIPNLKGVLSFLHSLLFVVSGYVHAEKSTFAHERDPCLLGDVLRSHF